MMQFWSFNPTPDPPIGRGVCEVVAVLSTLPLPMGEGSGVGLNKRRHQPFNTHKHINFFISL